MEQADVIVIGAGIVGLAHAWAAARLGLKVMVIERHPQAVGASIRNFGMVWPIGQPLGPRRDRALRSRQIWLDLAPAAGFMADPMGSLHLAYREDEWAVLEEFVTSHPDSPGLKLLTPSEVVAKSPAVQATGLRGGLWSATEVIVDPREAIAQLPAYLSSTYGVTFHFNTVATAVTTGEVMAGGQRWRGEQIIICSGSDLETLYPDAYARSGITKVKLQMLRTVPQPQGWRLGAALCGGLTLTHYEAFAHCPSLPQLKARIAEETPHFPTWGIHVMVSQNGQGELILGDSHEYGPNPDPFDRTALNDWILGYLGQFAQFPHPQIAATWHGVYSKLPGQTEWICEPEPGVWLVNGLGGAGMTLSFGLAEENWRVWKE